MIVRSLLSWLLPCCLVALPSSAQQPATAALADADAAFATALAEFRAGRFEPAYAAFAQLLADAGERADAELRWNVALAALRVQRSGDAEAAIQPLLQHADVRWQAEAEFVLAMVAHQRGERAVAAAQLADAEPLAWTMALRAMQQAIDGFARADRLRSSWAAAARNAERCSLRLREIEQLQAAAKKPDNQKTEAPEPPPAPPQPAEQKPEEVAPELAKEALTPAEVAQLLQRLRQQERDKRALRQQSAAPAARAGERFW